MSRSRQALSRPRSEARPGRVRPPDLSVVVPLRNERPSLSELYGQIRRACEAARLRFEAVFVDDGSTDGSFEVLESLHRRDRRVRAIQFRKNAGKSEALSAGFSAASGRLIVTMDADLQDDPAEIPALVRRIDEGYDLVSGWKKERRDPLSKRIPSRFFNGVTSLVSGLAIHDFNCGLKIYRSEVAKSLPIYGELHRYIPALAKWEGFRVDELPVHHRPRKYGKSKYGPSRFLYGFLDLLTVMFLSRYTRRPLHLFGTAGLIAAVAGAGILAYLVVLRIAKVSYLSNRPILFFGVLLLLLGIQFVSIGLLGEMIARANAPNRSYAVRRVLGD